MEVLWHRHPQGADEVVSALAARSDWAEPTIKTLLNRLLNKGAIRAEREGRRYLYSPVLTREAWVAQQSEGLRGPDAGAFFDQPRRGNVGLHLLVGHPRQAFVGKQPQHLVPVRLELFEQRR